MRRNGRCCRCTCCSSPSSASARGDCSARRACWTLEHMDTSVQDLKDKIAVVTGAAGTMGRATAQALQADGCRLVLVDIDATSLAALAASLGRAALPVACDISDPQAVAQAADRIRREVGDPDILVNNAGILSNN